MEYAKKEQLFLSSVDIDYVSLSELARISIDYKNLEPNTEEEYLQAMEFLSYLLNKYGNKLKYYLGPGVEQIDKTPEELVSWLKEIWHAGKYDEFDYAVWFDLKGES